jgi:hypothetical protein
MQMSQGGGETGEARPAGQRGSPWVNVALLVVSLVSSLVLIEVGYRVAAGLRVFKFSNWRTDEISMNRLGDRAIVDPVLGWTVKPWTDIDSFETIDYGIRRNAKETGVRTGAVLAVGDSFTEGWEVEDNESWPAVLEQMTGVPIVNAGIGGYGADQIVLRAEQLLPIVKPKALIVGLLESDIYRAGHSVFGAPKPYFTIENGELKFHPPEPLEPRGKDGVLSAILYKLRDALGYSAAADYLMARLNPNFWYSTNSQVHYRRANVDEAEVTCALLRRLKAQTDKEGIRSVLFMQYYAPIIMGSDRRTRNAQYVLTCAHQAGMRVVDQFSLLRRIAVADPGAMKEYYMHSDDTYGHMSPKGNRHAANLLALSLADWLQDLPGPRRPPTTPDSTASNPSE